MSIPCICICARAYTQMQTQTYKYIYWFSLREFFTRALAGGLSLVSEGLQVSSRLQDSSQYFSRLQQDCSLDYSFSDFQFLPSLLQVHCNCSKGTLYSWYYLYLHVPKLFFFSSLTRSQYLSIFFLLFLFCDLLGWLNQVDSKFSFFFVNQLFVWSSGWYLQMNRRKFYVSHSPGLWIFYAVGLCIYHMVISSVSHILSSQAESWNPFIQVFFIHLLHD